MTATATTVLTAIAALAVVLGLIWLAQAVARQSGRFRPSVKGSARLSVVQSLALDQRRRVQLVACDGQHFLVLTGGSQDLMLGFVPRADQT